MSEEYMMPQEKEVPLHLAHKSIRAVPYFDHDGVYASDSDAQFLSLGLSQWNWATLSLKVMRKVGGKWSRQSEELPVHRPIDLTLLLAYVLNGNRVIPKGTLWKQPEDIEILSSESRHDIPLGRVPTPDEYYKNSEKHKELEIIKHGLRALCLVLNELASKGVI